MQDIQALGIGWCQLYLNIIRREDAMESRICYRSDDVIIHNRYNRLLKWCWGIYRYIGTLTRYIIYWHILAIWYDMWLKIISSWDETLLNYKIALVADNCLWRWYTSVWSQMSKTILKLIGMNHSTYRNVRQNSWFIVKVCEKCISLLHLWHISYIFSLSIDITES